MLESTFWNRAAEGLTFYYLDGADTPIGPGFESGWRTPPHFVVAQVTRGSVALRFSAGNSLVVSAGEALCVAPGVTHNFVDVSGADNLSRWSHVNFLLPGNLEISTLGNFTQAIPAPAAGRVGEINGELARLPRDIMAMTLAECLRKRALGLELLALLLEGTGWPGPLETRWRELLQVLPALERIEKELHRPWDREEMARLAHLSPSRFAAVFKNALGEPPGTYLRERQLRRAQQLLGSTTLGLSEIAAQCGLGGAAQLSRQFRARYGLGPAAYRRRQKEDLPRGF